jgi:lysozyme family protein
MASEIYRRVYVTPFLTLEEIPPRLLGLLADSAVQHGVKRAISWLQVAIGAAGDGVLGPEALLRWRPYQAATRDVNEVYTAVLKLRIKFYAAIIHNDPAQATFANGWFNRVCEFI